MPTEDSLLGGRVRLLQPENGYRAAIDPVLLAAAVPAEKGDRVLELGAGSGAAALCLATRIPGVQVTGLEIQADLAALATGSAALGGVQGRVTFLAGDLLSPPPDITAGGFEHVFANPPYQKADHGHPPPHAAKAKANVEGAAVLSHWIAACVHAVHPGGSVTIIHRADRLAEILAALTGKLGDIRVLPLLPKGGKPPKRVIVRGIKGASGAPATVAGLVLHEADGTYTKATEAVLRDGVALRF